MAYTKITLNVPDIKYSFQNYSNMAVKAANIKMVQRINNTYGQYFSQWAQVFDIPKGVLIAFAATESSGTMAKPNQYLATGIMQVTPAAIYECARKWKAEVSTDLPSEAVSVLNAQIPTLLVKSTTLASVKSKLLTLLERDANFNIMAGTLVLRWLLERFSTIFTGGQINKAMVAYNAGAYTKSISTGTRANKIPIDSTSLSQNRLVPRESRAYLVKMLGIDGFLSIIYKDKAI